MRQSPQAQVENVRIESWKQIASFFGKDERTVKRWERERALPVHRLPGERGGVFAYTLELDQWLNSKASRRSPLAVPIVLEIAPPQDKPAKIFPEPLVPAQAPPPAPGASVGPDRFPLMVILFCATCVIVAIPYLARAMHGVVGAKTATHNVPPPGVEARESYLMGRYYWSRRTDGSLKLAVDAFTQAVVQDPTYARAYAGLAESYELMPQYSSMPSAQAFPRALTAAQRAIQLDPSLAEAHRALAFSQFFWEWHVQQSMAEYRKAIQLDPHDVEGHHWYATALLSLGRIPEAKAEIERARELDPTSRSILTDGALIGYWSGDIPRSLQKLRDMERTEPDFITAPRYLSRIALEQQDFPAFILQTQLTARISGNPQDQAIAAAAAQGWARAGRSGLLEALRTVQKQAFEEGRTSGYDLAHTSAMLGDKPAAVAALQAAYEAHDYMLMTLFRGDMQTMLQGYPPFEALKTQVKERMNS